MAAAAFGLENTYLKILQQHPDLEVRDSFNFTALHYAVYGGHANVVEILLNHGANIAGESGPNVTIEGSKVHIYPFWFSTSPWRSACLPRHLP